MKALIVDTEELFRLSLREVISVTGPFTDIIEAANEHDFLSLTANNDSIDLIVLTPSQLGKDGGQWVHLVRRLYPSAAVVVFFNKENPAVLRVKESGVELLPRDSSITQTVTTIRRAMRLPCDSMSAASRKPSTPDVMSALRSAKLKNPQKTSNRLPKLDRLSFRQRQILAMAADGLPNKEIAARLGIAEGTVKAHMHAIFKVMGVSNRTQAVIQYSSFDRPAAHIDTNYNAANGEQPIAATY